MDGTEDKLSESQTKIFTQFKENLSDVLTTHHTDSILRKFLKAKNYNLESAERNFRQVTAGAIFWGHDTILDIFKKNEIEETYEINSFFGFAKDRTVIRYFQMGKLDVEGFLMAESHLRLCSFFTYVIESDLAMLREKSEMVGKETNDCTYIFDLDGCSVQQIAHKSVIEASYDFFRIIQDCYPSIWRRILLINVPYSFDKIFSMFKPFLRGPFLEKFQVIPKASTGDVLLKYIDEDVLPVFLGGKRLDSEGNPECSAFVKSGGKIPKEYYVKNRIPLLSQLEPGVICVVIGARSVYNHSLVAKKTGSKLYFQYRTENGSINFSVLYKNPGPDPEKPEIPPSDEILDENDKSSGLLLLFTTIKTPTHLTQNCGEANITSPGVYILRFDNTSSWFTSRKLILRTEIIESPNQKCSFSTDF